MKRQWSVRLSAEADRLTLASNRAWPAQISLHAANHIAEAARSLRKAADVMAERERLAMQAQNPPRLRRKQ